MSYDRDELLKATTIQKAWPMAMNTARNLRRLHTAPCATSLGKPLNGTPAVIVGAGPSLDATELHPGETAIIAVNSSAPALAKRGIPIDALVVVESIDLGSHVLRGAEIARSVVLDLSTHPNHWDAGPSQLWFASHSNESLDLCYRLGVCPLEHGGAAILAALALALEWGANPITLVGCDLSFTTTHAYADGAGWHGLTLRHEGERMVFEGRTDRDAVHQLSGVPPVPRNRRTFHVPSVDGGTVPTTADYADQIAHLSRVAQQHPHTRLYNASQGAHVPGWDPGPLPRYPKRQDTLHTTIAKAAPPDTTAALAHVLAELDATTEQAQAILDGHPAVGPWSALSDMLTARDQILMREQGLSSDARAEAFYVATIEACRRLRELLTD